MPATTTTMESAAAAVEATAHGHSAAMKSAETASVETTHWSHAAMESAAHR